MSGWGWWAGTSDEFMNIGGPFATREEAIEAGRDHQCGDPFWIVEARLAVWSPPSAAAAMDEMADSSDELFYDDGFPGFDGGREAEKAAEADLQSVLNEWFARHQHILPTPTAFDGCSKAETIDARDTDGSPSGRDAQQLDGEAATAGCEAIAQGDEA